MSPCTGDSVQAISRLPKLNGKGNFNHRLFIRDKAPLNDVRLVKIAVQLLRYLTPTLYFVCVENSREIKSEDVLIVLCNRVRIVEALGTVHLT